MCVCGLCLRGVRFGVRVFIVFGGYVEVEV